MNWFKKEEAKEELTAVCENCGHIFTKETGQCVKTEIVDLYGVTITIIYHWYCSQHKKPYDRIENTLRNIRYYKKNPPYTQINIDGSKIK